MYVDLPKTLLEKFSLFREFVLLIHVGRTLRKPCRRIPKKSVRAKLASCYCRIRLRHTSWGGSLICLRLDIGVLCRCSYHSPSAFASGPRFRQDVSALWNSDVAIRTGVLNLGLASSRNLRASKYRDSVIETGFRDTPAVFWETGSGPAEFVPSTSVSGNQTRVQQHERH